MTTARALLALALVTGCTGCTGDKDPSPTDTEVIDTPDPGPVEAVDPLSMPDSPTLDLAGAATASSCATCHPDQVAAWGTSNHAYAMVDPVYQALVRLRQTHTDGLEDRFCTQCHSAIGVRSGEIGPGFRFEDLSPPVMEGVTCVACHGITEVQRDFNAGHVLSLDGIMRGPLNVSQDPPSHGCAEEPVFDDPVLCGSCHDVVELNGLDLERPYREWLQSPARDAGQGCADCHMPAYDGQAAVGGPPREGLRDHHFVGVELPLRDGFLPEAEIAAQQARVDALLATAATLRLATAPAAAPGGTLDVRVTAHNNIAGHNLPTGSTFIRQLWLELTATDATGRVLFQTGDLDANGDLRDVWSELDPFGDHDLVTLHSSLVDAEGQPTFLPWAAREHTSAALPPRHDRTWTLFVPTPGDVVGPVTIQARLRFRSHAPYLLRAIGMSDAVPKVQVHDLAADTLVVPVAPTPPAAP